jgi:hypothetical protein
MALLLVLFIGMMGLAVDCAHAFIVKRQLQAATDSAALAGAYEMTQSSATSAVVKTFVTNYGSSSSGYNYYAGMSVGAPTVNLKCLSTVATWGVYCTGSPTGNNAIQVMQTATVHTWFMGIFSMFGASSNDLVVKAISTAAMRGAPNEQYNVAIVIDTTSSMGSNDTDANCNNTRIYCALAGVQVLLKSLSPCTASSTSTSCTPFDSVSLFTFPNVSANVSSDKTSYSTQDTTCPTSNPTIPSYSTPTAGATWAVPTSGTASYQVTDFLANYSSTNKSGAALNTSSALSIASGASTTKNCGGLQTPGGDGTYLAGAIYSAQSALIAAQKKNSGSLNALIVLSDGAANTTKMTGGKHNGNTYPSLDYQCQQSITAANYASSHGTTVYTVAYGASTANNETQCTTDPTLSPCSELSQMATTAGDFYSDATASQNKGQCTSTSNPNLTLDQIFQQIHNQMTYARLIPDSTT